ncbi:MAG TPA: hypothetical protein VHY76_06445, partial [Acetobacteraceae bacterium]|nr:hypothetical protein [Acetobacteraceae bacterium]
MATTQPLECLIGGQYALDPARKLTHAGGGLPTCAAIDRRASAHAAGPALMAVQARLSLPPRARVITTLHGARIDGVLLPFAAGPGPERSDAPGALPGAVPSGAWVVCPAPPGPPLTLERPWTETELIDCVLRPIAAALDGLAERGVTHRAIRPNNVFRAGPGEPCVLGCAWASPPAALQPDAFEPPYIAACLPAGRGEGSIADDVFALGVLLIALASGALPGDGLDDAALLRRRLDQGSFAATAGRLVLPPLIADLARTMLAEDPEHRPSPALLLAPSMARTRRTIARDARRAQRPFEADGEAAGGDGSRGDGSRGDGSRGDGGRGDGVWGARALAHALGRDPARGAAALRQGSVDRWLRRSLGDPMLAVRLDELQRADPVVAHGGDEPPPGAAETDSLLVMRTCAAIDPLAPLWWHGMALWPDGLGPALAEASVLGAPGPLAAFERLVAVEAIVSWAHARGQRSDVIGLRIDARQHRAWLRGGRASSGRLGRLCVALNPLLPCLSPLVDHACVIRPAELLMALDAAAATPSRAASPIDAPVADFLSARSDERLDADLAACIDAAATPAQAALAQLRVLARVHARSQVEKLPGLAAWSGEAARAAIGLCVGRSRRRKVEAKLPAAIATGRLPAILALLDDPAAQEADAIGVRAAIQEVAAIDDEMAALADGAAARGAASRR